MTICVDARLLGPFGIGTYVKNILLHLKESSLALHALIHAKQLAFQELWDVIHPIVIEAPIYSVREQIELPRKIPKNALLWSPHYNIPLLFSGKRVTTIHDVRYLAFAHTLSWLQKIYAQQMITRAFRKSHRVIVPSSFTREELIKYMGTPSKSIQVIPLGVDPTTFSSKHRQEDGQLQKQYGLFSPFILFVGDPGRWHKNLIGALRAVHILHSKGRVFSLVITGKIADSLRAHLVQAFPNLRKNLHFLGSVEENHLPFLYRSAAMLLFPSYYEGFGLPPVEAMSCGCPVVAARAASLPEVCGDAALYTAPDQPEEMAKAVELLLCDQGLRNTCIEKGWKRSEQFRWKATAEAHLRIFEELI